MRDRADDDDDDGAPGDPDALAHDIILRLIERDAHPATAMAALCQAAAVALGNHVLSPDALRRVLDAECRHIREVAEEVFARAHAARRGRCHVFGDGQGGRA